VYCPHVGLAYCMLLHSFSWVAVCGRSVCDLVDACGDWRERERDVLIIMGELRGCFVLVCGAPAYLVCLLVGVCPALVVLRVVFANVYF